MGKKWGMQEGRSLKQVCKNEVNKKRHGKTREEEKKEQRDRIKRKTERAFITYRMQDNKNK